jgi:hypothetical protein
MRVPFPAAITTTFNATFIVTFVSMFDAMFTAFSKLFGRGAIISLALAALGGLAGCSAVRLGYDQGPFLAHWWLDSRLAFTPDQSARTKEALAQWFVWHRATQLNDYAGWLARTRGESGSAVTPQQVCRWTDELRRRLDPLVERLLPTAAEVVITLTPEQLARLERRLEEDDAKRRKDFLQPQQEQRWEASTERTIDRFESFYGTLEPAQRTLVAASVRASPFDPARWWDGRQTSQAEMMATLRKLSGDRRPREQVVADLRQAVQRRWQAAPPDNSGYRARLALHQCELAAALHNAATPAQRRHLAEKLEGWEGDMRALAARGPTQVASRP